jgi:archaellum component FlaC
MEKMYFRQKGNCVCQHCGTQFEKPLSEIKRNEKLNRPNFCNRTCVGKHNVKNFGKNRSSYDISQHSNNRTDEYTKFKYHFRNIKKRNKEIDITIEDLKEQWDVQKGICVFTGVQLILSSYSKIKSDPIYAASLDRINNDKGYVKGNIRWVSRSINWMKNEMDDETLHKLINLLIENKKSPV